MTETITIDQRVQKLISHLTRNSDGIVEWGSFLPNNARKPSSESRRSSSSSSSRSSSSSSRQSSTATTATNPKPTPDGGQSVHKTKVPTDSSRLKDSAEAQHKILSILKAMTQPLDPLVSPLHIPETTIVHKPTPSVSPDKIVSRSAEKPADPNKDLKRKKREGEEANIREKYENLVEESKRLKTKLTENDREIRRLATVYPFVLNPVKNT